jgi:Flp pilus assembly pilin Flp
MSEAVTKYIVRLQTLAATARDREDGQTLVEYALILALVSILTIGTLLLITDKLNSTFTQIANTL